MTNPSTETDIKGATIFTIIAVIAIIALQVFYIGKSHHGGILYYIVDCLLIAIAGFTFYKDIFQAEDGEGAGYGWLVGGFISIALMFIWFWAQTQK